MLRKSVIALIIYWITFPTLADTLFQPTPTENKSPSFQAMSPDDFKNAVRKESQQNLKNAAQEAINVGKQQTAQLPAPTLNTPPPPPTPPSQPESTTANKNTMTPPAKQTPPTNENTNTNQPESPPPFEQPESSYSSDQQTNQNNSQNDTSTNSNQKPNAPENSGGFNLKY